MESREDKGYSGILRKKCAIFSINRRMIPSKAAYFLTGGYLGSHTPFLNIFFTSIGLSESQAGFISGFRFLASTIVYPIWGVLLDYTGRKKLILIILCLGSAFPVFCMPWMARIFHINAFNGTFNDGNGSNESVRLAYESNQKMNSEESLNVLFYVLLGLMFFASMFTVPLSGYFDTLVIRIVKNNDRKISFGLQRVFLSVGYGLANYAAGIAADHYDVTSLSNYAIVFFMYLPYVLLIIPVGLYVIRQTELDQHKELKKNVKPETTNVNIAAELFSLLRKLDVIFFLITTFVSGSAMNLYLNFVFLLMRDKVTSSKSKMGLVVLVSSISEIILFPFTAKLIKLLRGTYQAIALGILSYFIRFFIMSYVQTFWIFMLLQTLHGIGFALSWAAMMEYVHQIAPGVISGSMFSILQCVHFSLGALVANTVGGNIYEQFGGQLLFRGMGIVCGVWFIIMTLYYGGNYVAAKHSMRENISIECNKSEMERKEMKSVLGIAEIGIDNYANVLNENNSMN